jgi:hypothetical protein
MLEFFLDGPMTGGMTWEKASGPKSKWKPPDNAKSIINLIVEVVQNKGNETTEATQEEEHVDEATQEELEEVQSTPDEIAMAKRVAEWTENRSALLEEW